MNMQTVFERYKCYGFVGDTPLDGDCSYEWWLNLNFEENEGVGVGVVSMKTGREFTVYFDGTLDDEFDENVESPLFDKSDRILVRYDPAMRLLSVHAASNKHIATLSVDVQDDGEEEEKIYPFVVAKKVELLCDE